MDIRKGQQKMIAPQGREGQKLKTLAQSVKMQNLAIGGLLAGQLAVAGFAHAGPQGGVVVGGQGTISNPNLTTTQIKQLSDRLAIDWKSFNVNQNELVRFLQPSSSSLVLNRILDQNPSVIRGSIDANGNVLLVNPRGIMFTETATINVGGLVASGMSIDPDDFMNGDLLFSSIEGEDGAVINRGVINASSVALLGKHVANEAGAMISADVVSLSAGDEALLTFDADGYMGVKVTKALMENEMGVDAAVINSGEIDGQKVLLQAKISEDLFTNAVNNEGIIRARGIDTSGGTIRLFGGEGQVANSGTLDASGDTDGGEVELEGKKVVNSGDITADGENGQGGSIRLLGDDVAVTGSAKLSAQGTEQGGEILVGGDYQGKNPDIRNAKTTYIGEDVVIDASGNDFGDGGKVIVWADEDSYFYGFIDASSGLLGGDGGLIETSAKKNLTLKGKVVAKSHKGGKAGLWLIDPEDLKITKSGSGTNELKAKDIEDTLDFGTSVEIITADREALDPGSQTGTIIVDDVIEYDGNSAVTLRLVATKDIIVNYAVRGKGANDNLSVEMIADENINVNANIDTRDGDLTLTADANGDNSGAMTIGSGVTLNSGDGDNRIASGNISLSAYTLHNNGTITNDNDDGQEGSIQINATTFINNGQILGHSGNVSVAAASLLNQLSSGAIVTEGADIDIDAGSFSNSGQVNSGTGKITIDVGVGVQTSSSVLGTLISSHADGVSVVGNAVDRDHFSFTGGKTYTIASSNNMITVSDANNNGIHLESADTISDDSGAVIIGSEGLDQFTVMSDETVRIDTTLSNTQISGVTKVDGRGEADTVVGQLNQGWELVDDPVDADLIADSVKANNITFENVETANNTGSGSLTGTDQADSFTIDTAYDVTAAGIKFTGLSSIDAGAGSDSVTATSNTTETYTIDVNDSDKVAISDGTNSLTFDNIESVDAGGGTDNVIGSTASETLTITGDNAVTVKETATTKAIAFTNIDSVNGNDGTDQIVGRDGVNEKITINAATNVTIEANAKSLVFTNIDQVNAGTGSDSVVGLADQSWELVDTDNSDSSDAFRGSGVQFSGVETASAVSGSSSLTGSDKVDSFTVTADNTVTAVGTSFGGISSVDGGDGEDSIKTQDVDENFTVKGDDDFDVVRDVNGAATLTVSAVESVNAGVGNDTVTGSTESEVFEIKGPGAINVKRVGATTKSLDFTNIVSADGGATGTDKVQGSTEAETYTLTGNNSFSVVEDATPGVSIAFNGMEEVDAGAGNNNTVAGQAGTVNETAIINSANNVTVKETSAAAGTGVTFDKISRVDLKDGSDTVQGFDAQSWLLKDTDTTLGADAVEVGGIDVTGVETATNTGTGTLTGTGGDDSFTLDANYDVTAAGIEFTNVGSVDAGGGDDSVTATNATTETYTIDLNDSDKVAISDGTNSLTFDHIENVDGNGGTDNVVARNINETLTITGNSAVTVKDAASTTAIDFTNINSVDGNGGSDQVVGRDDVNEQIDIDAATDVTITANATSLAFTNIERVDAGAGSDRVQGLDGESWTLLDIGSTGSSNAFSASGIQFEGVENADNDSDVGITGSDSADSFQLTADKTVTVAGTSFSNITSVSGGNGSDSLQTQTADETLTVTGDQSLTVQRSGDAGAAVLTVSGVETINAHDGDDQVIGSTADEVFEVTGAGAINVERVGASQSLNFSNIESVDGGTVGTDKVQGSTEAETFTLTGNDSFSVAQDSAPTVTMAFSGIEEVDAGTGNNNTVAGQAGNVDETATINSANNVTVKETSAAAGTGVTFDKVSYVNLGDGSDAVNGVSGQNWSLVDTDSSGSSDAFSASGVQFSAVEQASTTGNAVGITGSDVSDSFQVTADNTIDVAGTTFSNINSIAGGDGADSIETQTADESFTITGDQNFTVLRAGANASTTLSVSAVETVDANTGADSVTGTGSNEVFEIMGASSVNVERVGASLSLDFDNIESVSGGGAATNDEVLGTTAEETYTLTGNSSFTVSQNTTPNTSIAFSGITEVDTGLTGSDTVKGQVGVVDETVTINSANNATVAVTGSLAGEGVTFDKVNRIDLVDGSDTVKGFDAQSWLLKDTDTTVGADAVEVGGIDVTGVETASNTGTGDLTGTNVADSFTFDANYDVTAAGITFTDINRVDGGVGNDSVTATSTTTASETYTIDAGDSDRVAITDGSNNLDFDNIEAVDAGAGTDSVIARAENETLTITGDSAVTIKETASTKAIAFTNIESVNGNGGTDNVIGRDGVNEQIAINAATNVTITANNTSLVFTDIDSVDAGTGRDHVTGLANQLWELESSNGTSANRFSAAGMDFDGVETASSSGEGTIEGTNLGDAYSLTAVRSINVAGTTFSGVKTVNAGSGTDTVANNAGASLKLENELDQIIANNMTATVSTIAVYFEGIEQVTNTGAFSGPSANTTYTLDTADSFAINSIDFDGVTAINGGVGDNTLIGPNVASTWIVNGRQGSVGGVSFANMNTLRGGSAADTMSIASGSAGNIYTGAGADQVTFNGGVVNGLYLETGNDAVILNSAGSDATILDGGADNDTLTNRVSGLTWNINSNAAGVNSVGPFDFTGFENLSNETSSLLVKTSLASAFSGNAVGFAGGLNLGFNSSSNINYVTSSGVTGNLQANELVLTAGGNVDLETNINLLELHSTGSIDASISENDDLVIREINVGSGNLLLTSKNLGILTAESRGNTHITAGTVTLGNVAERWRDIGDQFNPLRLDVQRAIDITAISFVTPELFGPVQTFTSTGTEVESLVSAGASEGVKSVVQNQVDQFTQIDPAIFDSVNPYSVDVDAVNTPEFRLVAGELIPTAATATGNSEDSDQADDQPEDESPEE